MQGNTEREGEVEGKVGTLGWLAQKPYESQKGDKVGGYVF